MAGFIEFMNYLKLGIYKNQNNKRFKQTVEKITIRGMNVIFVKIIH